MSCFTGPLFTPWLTQHIAFAQLSARKQKRITTKNSYASMSHWRVEMVVLPFHFELNLPRDFCCVRSCGMRCSFVPTARVGCWVHFWSDIENFLAEIFIISEECTMILTFFHSCFHLQMRAGLNWWINSGFEWTCRVLLHFIGTWGVGEKFMFCTTRPYYQTNQHLTQELSATTVPSQTCLLYLSWLSASLRDVWHLI